MDTEIRQVTTQIANGQTASSGIDISGFTVVAVITPAALTGTTMTFQASLDGSTYRPLHDADGAVSIPVGTSRQVAVDPVKFLGVKYVKVVSGSSESGNRDITLVLRRLQ